MKYKFHYDPRTNRDYCYTCWEAILNALDTEPKEQVNGSNQSSQNPFDIVDLLEEEFDDEESRGYEDFVEKHFNAFYND